VPVRIKVCGLTRVESALACVECGADAIGLNFWPGSKRRCAFDEAAGIVEAVGDRARVVAVFVDASREAIAEARAATGIEWVQLHGREPPELVTALAPHAYKALHVCDAAEVDGALAFPGDELLVDASLPGLPGGTGLTCDWDLAARVSRARRVWLAGGLRPENVREAVQRVRPFGVDVASGVERAPGEKDLARVRAFVEAARSAG
jgi:phosphoribosylanthranilate isomerase